MCNVHVRDIALTELLENSLTPSLQSLHWKWPGDTIAYGQLATA